MAQEQENKAQEKESSMYKCGNCMRIVYSMETGKGGVLKCCDEKMKKMSKEERKPYHPGFMKPGSP
jgi:acetyl-CoA carboxylase beta subunit